MNSFASGTDHAGTRTPWQAWAIISLGSIAIVVFSQSGMLGTDEGFHVLAASLVGAGKVPYRDFFYQHPPLFPYLYAGWMQIAGETWRSAHLFSALLTLGTVWLVATYLLSRYTASRVSAAVFTFLLLCLNPQFVWLGTVGHPYALCMFLSVLAFRLVIHGIQHATKRVTFLAGLAAGGSVLSSFLVAPILPVVSIWILFQERTGFRTAHLACFVAGAAVWLVPLAWFFVQAPQPMLFELVEYHLYYRGNNYRIPPSDAYFSGLRQLVGWARSWDGLAASILALVGFWFVMFRSTQNRLHRAELALVAALAAGFALFISTPYPTFSFYFVVVTPFLCVISYHGVTALAGARWTFRQSAFGLCLCALVLVATVIRPASRVDQEYWNFPNEWGDYDAIAAAINRVTPPGEFVHAPEQVLFAARRLPGQGLENAFAVDLDISPGLITSLNIVPQSQIQDRIRQGWFAAVWLEANDTSIDFLALSRVYDGRMKLRTIAGDGFLFWRNAPVVHQPDRP
jgi:hypothetical protein